MGDPLFKATVAAIFVGAFGLFLIWKGIVGDRTRTSTGEALFPKWMFLLSGIVVLVLPVTFLVIRLTM